MLNTGPNTGVWELPNRPQASTQAHVAVAQDIEPQTAPRGLLTSSALSLAHLFRSSLLQSCFDDSPPYLQNFRWPTDQRRIRRMDRCHRMVSLSSEPKEVCDISQAIATAFY
jgi:hypothetical protein